MTWLLELPEFSFWTKIKIQVFEFKGRHCNVSWPYMRFTPYMMIFTYVHDIISSSAHWLSITVNKLLQKPFLKKWYYIYYYITYVIRHFWHFITFWKASSFSRKHWRLETHYWHCSWFKQPIIWSYLFCSVVELA